MQTEITLDLNGNFALRDADGGDLSRFIGNKYKALIAVLACADRQSRTADFIKDMIWERSPEPQASGSLRTGISCLRRIIGDHIMRDRTHIWLERVKLVPIAPKPNQEFFEDAPKLGERFEDWLSIERSMDREFESGPVPILSGQLRHHPKTTICVTACLPEGGMEGAPGVLKFIDHQLVASLRHLEQVSVLGAGNSSTSSTGTGGPDLHCSIALSPLGREYWLKAELHSSLSGELLWNTQRLFDLKNFDNLRDRALASFISEASNAINNIATAKLHLHLPRSEFSARLGKIADLAMSMNPGATRRIKAIIQADERLHDSPMANAWLAFSYCAGLGETRPAIHKEFLEEAESCAQRALAISGENPVAYALIGHLYGFAFRKQELAGRLLNFARNNAPTSAITFDLCAMHELYGGSPNQAFSYATRAMKLGHSSSYLGLIQASVAITAAVRGKHDLALGYGELALAKTGSFLALERHLFASLALSGQVNQARKLLQSIRNRDPEFSAEALRDEQYPVPSHVSREHIRAGFKSLEKIH